MQADNSLRFSSWSTSCLFVPSMVNNPRVRWAAIDAVLGFPASRCFQPFSLPLSLSCIAPPRRQLSRAHRTPSGPLDSSIAHHRRTLELVLQKGHASRRITSSHPVHCPRTAPRQRPRRNHRSAGPEKPYSLHQRPQRVRPRSTTLLVLGLKLNTRRRLPKGAGFRSQSRAVKVRRKRV